MDKSWRKSAQFFTTPWTVACTKLLHPWDFQGKSTGVGCHFLLQRIFPTQGSNPGLLHCRQTIYCLSQQGSPWINPTHPSLILNITSLKRHFLGPGSQIRCSGILSNGALYPLQHWQHFTFTNVIMHYACILDQDTPLFQVNGSPSNAEHSPVTLVWHSRLATIWPLGD